MCGKLGPCIKSRDPSGARFLGCGPLGLHDIILHGLRALRPCDPRNGAMTFLTLFRSQIGVWLLTSLINIFYIYFIYIYIYIKIYFFIIQGVFLYLYWYPPKKLKYGKPRLGEPIAVTAGIN